jgi:hypothetical protein
MLGCRVTERRASTKGPAHEAGLFPFMVSAFDSGDQAEVLAAANVSVAGAAFQAAIPARTDARIILHQGAVVLGQHPAPTTPALPK